MLLVPAIQAQCKAFSLKTTYDASNFFDEFVFRDAKYYDNYGGDPTNGSVNYLSKKDAISEGIARYQKGQVYLAVDHAKVAGLRRKSKTVHGRNSVRLESKGTWNSGIMIADIQHMPGTACGVWPSLWAYNFDEDPVGEIDIIEGINMQDSNDVSLHTCGACKFSKIGGINERTNCNNGGTLSQQCEDGTNYDGCGNTMKTNSYGKGFNDRNGGVYATWLDADFIKIYWWNRANIPKDIKAGRPDPSGWGTPATQFLKGSGCDPSKYFKGLTIIVNISLCGDNINQEIWDDECRQLTGVKTCDSYVANNPKAFKEAYWLFNSIKLYK